MPNAETLLSDLLDTCNASEGCAHEALPHIGNVDGIVEAHESLVTMLHMAAEVAPDVETLRASAHHILVVASALGYAIGAGHAYDVTLSESVTVPDSLASLDLVGEAFGDRPEDN